MSKQQTMLDYLDDMIEQLETEFNGDRQGRDREVGFVIMSFPINGAIGHSAYMSNGVNRKHVAKMMKQLITRLEANRETIQ